jgi:hypothetical protein
MDADETVAVMAALAEGTRVQLSQEHKDKVVEWLRATSGPAFKCGVCGDNEWLIADRLLGVQEFFPEWGSVGGAVFPVVGMTCTKCGHAVFFSAVKIGLIPPDTRKVTAVTEQSQ